MPTGLLSGLDKFTLAGQLCHRNYYYSPVFSFLSLFYFPCIFQHSTDLDFSRVSFGPLTPFFILIFSIFKKGVERSDILWVACGKLKVHLALSIIILFWNHLVESNALSSEIVWIHRLISSFVFFNRPSFCFVFIPKHIDIKSQGSLRCTIVYQINL